MRKQNAGRRLHPVLCIFTRRKAAVSTREERIILTTTERSVLTILFSASTLRGLGDSKSSPRLARLLEQAVNVLGLETNTKLQTIFDEAFRRLRLIGDRDDYIYRSAITDKILLGRHSLRTASILHEARAGKSRADVVILNGTSTAYEIKSERDGLSRLTGQLDDYMKVFAAVNIVTSPQDAKKAMALAPAEVGVISLTKRFSLRTERRAHTSPERVSAATVLDSLRRAEAFAIIKALGQDQPRVPNTQLRGVMLDIFESVEPALLHAHMVRTLRSTRSQATASNFLSSLPTSLRAAGLALRLDQCSQERLVLAMDQSVASVLRWR